MVNNGTICSLQDRRYFFAFFRRGRVSGFPEKREKITSVLQPTRCVVAVVAYVQTTSSPLRNNRVGRGSVHRLFPQQSDGGTFTKVKFYGGSLLKGQDEFGGWFENLQALSNSRPLPVTGNKRPPLSCPPHIEIVEINSPLSDGDP